ncbi:MAG: hypothetical protein KDJ14_13105 [Xanthomonadales bacterium]|nr:hypothetical protein [Xanthomonadales bacterium]
MHSITLLPLLRLALRLDGAVSSLAGVLTLALSEWMATELGAPPNAVVALGVFMLAYGLSLLLLARTQAASPILLWGIVIGNALWAAASVALAFSSLIAPTTPGLVVLIGQAVAVFGLTEMQFIGLRRSLRDTFTAPAHA